MGRHQGLISKMHLEMDVRRSTVIPTRIDGLEFDNAIGIARLDAAQECLTCRALLGISGVDSCGIAVPDLSERIGNGKTGAGAHHSQQEAQRNAGLSLSDVAPHLTGVEPIGPLGLLGGERASGLCEHRARSPSV